MSEPVDVEGIRKRQEQLLLLIAEQRKSYGHEPWWREDALGIVAVNNCDALLAEVDRQNKENFALRNDNVRLRQHIELAFHDCRSLAAVVESTAKELLLGLSQTGTILQASIRKDE